MSDIWWVNLEIINGWKFSYCFIVKWNEYFRRVTFFIFCAIRYLLYFDYQLRGKISTESSNDSQKYSHWISSRLSSSNLLDRNICMLTKLLTPHCLKLMGNSSGSELKTNQANIHCRISTAPLNCTQAASYNLCFIVPHILYIYIYS